MRSTRIRAGFLPRIISADGPGTGIEPTFDGGPGDEIPGNGAYDLPIETVVTGQINIH